MHSTWFYLYDHAWMFLLRHVLSELVTLSGDQNEVFESLLDFQRFISWNSTVKGIFFFFNIWLFGLINLYTKSFFTLEKAEIPP